MGTPYFIRHPVHLVRYAGRVIDGKSGRIFVLMVGAGLMPVAALALAMSRAAHDLPLILARGPEPIAGLCREAITYTLSPVAHASYLVLGGLALVCGTLGLLSLVSTITRTTRCLRQDLAVRVPLPASLGKAFAQAGIRRGLLVDSEDPRAFTFGYLRPKVAVTSALVDNLGASELQAVLLHEAAHARRRDPLRMLIVSSLARAFLVAPVLREVAVQFQAAKEIDADQDVILRMGSKRALISALLQADEARPATAVARFGDVLHARLASLEGMDPFPPLRRRLLARAVSAATVMGVTLGLFVVTTGAVDAHVLHVCSG